MRDMVAAMRISQEGLGAIRGPFHRLLQFARGPDADGFFGIVKDLGAEAAADIGRYHADLVFGQAEYESAKDQPDDMRVLRGRVDRGVVGAWVVFTDGAARLHRVWRQPVVYQVDLGDMRCLGEGGLSRSLVAEVPVVAEITGRIGMHLRCVGFQRGHHVDDRRQHLIVDIDGLRGIAGFTEAARNHHCDLIADMAHMLDGDDVVARRLVWLALLVLDGPAADQAADLVGCHILAGIDRDYARHLAGGVGIDRLDFRESVWGAEEVCVKLAGAVDVVGVMALTRNEAEIFLATD